MNASEKLNICVINPNYYRSSGVTKVIKNIRQGSKSLPIKWYFIDCQYGSGVEVESPEWLSCERVEVIKLMESKWSLFIEMIKLVRFIEENNIRIIHVHHRRLVGILNFIKLFKNIRIIYTAHLTYSRNIFFSILRVDLAIAISSSVRENLFKTTNWAKIIEMIHNPADFLDGINVYKDIASQYISCIARLDKVKNHATLLKAWAKTSPANHRYILRLVGEGDLKSELVKLTEDLKIEKYVEFLGYTNNVEEIIDTSAFMVLMSHVEGHPLTVIEAAGRGIPTLLSNVDGSKDCAPRYSLLPNRINQTSIDDIAQALISWISNIDKVSEYGQLFYEKWKSISNKEFVAEKYFETYLKLYHE
ncbi:MAG: glycosyltransferase family 4 protein [Spirosomataceae bacterium]